MKPPYAPPTMPEKEEYVFPPMRTFIVKVLDDKAEWKDVTVACHTIETTRAGGINFIDIVVYEGSPVQRMRQAYPYGEWKSLREIDFEQQKPSRIIH